MIIYSCPHPLGGVGPGIPLGHIDRALQNHFVRVYAVLHPGKFPELSDPGRLGDANGAAFDEVAESSIDPPAAPDGPRSIFLGGGGASLLQMHRLKNAGVRRVGTLWFSSWWGYASRVLAEEYARFNIKAPPIHPFVRWRAEHEQRLSDFMVVPSEACKATYPTDLRPKIHVAEFGVDTARFKPRTTPREPDPFYRKRPLQVLFPATNPARKGLWYVIEAMRRLTGGPIHITVSGGHQVRQGWGQATISSVGWVPDEQLVDLYQAHDVLLLPSVEEGQALAALEAMACGLPVIVTPEVGLPTGSGAENGVITIKSRSAEAVASALESVLREPHMVPIWGAAARAEAERRPWSRFRARIVEIVETELRS